MGNDKKLNPTEELLIVELDDRYEFGVLEPIGSTNGGCTNSNDCTNTNNTGGCKNTGTCFY